MTAARTSNRNRLVDALAMKFAQMAKATLRRLSYTSARIATDQEPEEAIQYGNVWLPPREIRFGSAELSDNRTYVQSATQQLERLAAACGLSSSSHLLDFGCGQGRLAIGLQAQGFEVAQYVGIDTHAPSIRWCQRWLTTPGSPFRFIHLPAYNERYNADEALSKQTFPVEDASFDVGFLNSVFSHMLPDDIAFYSAELARVLRRGGRLYTTAFVELDCEPVAENPDGYLEHMGPSRGPLHRVRYERGFLTALLERHGFRVDLVDHHSEVRTGQSAILATRVG